MFPAPFTQYLAPNAGEASEGTKKIFVPFENFFQIFLEKY